MINSLPLHTQADQLISIALQEDIGSGDKTTACLVDPGAPGKASVIAKEELTLSGINIFVRVFQLLNSQVRVPFLAQDGDIISADGMIAELEGPLYVLLTGERTALNFIQHLSGIATLTAQFVEKIKPYGVQLLDTRKTTPGLRKLEKDAVRTGGGTNHRMGLFDGILIKDNHISVCGTITQAVKKAKSDGSPLIKIEVEVRTIKELIEALEAGPDMIMLDNMHVADIRKAVEITGGNIPLEVSGNVTLDTAEEIAQTGINYISAGAITHSARACDISMYIRNE
jgi:nicotinate-nucleotide pyrophosphorylase (carboxylating)